MFPNHLIAIHSPSFQAELHPSEVPIAGEVISRRPKGAASRAHHKADEEWARLARLDDFVASGLN